MTDQELSVACLAMLERTGEIQTLAIAFALAFILGGLCASAIWALRLWLANQPIERDE